MTWLRIVNIATSILLTICYTYQFYYIIYAMFVKPKRFPKVIPSHRYAVMLSARNEENVIGYLLDSINSQTYPSELVDVYVVADNCNDKTAEVSAGKGAFVYERFNKELIGKGYALDYLFSEVFKKVGKEYYDGYFVFDADNLLEPNYIEEMDKCFSQGNRIITSYRNSKNYGDNWISAGYALWFIREAKYLNSPRYMLNTSCAVSGTGFLVHRDIINEQDGWKHFLLTEDIQFSIDKVIHGEKVAYCHWAMLYDEQPTSFRQSWRQRLRWSKGFLQVIGKYGTSLVKRIFKAKSFSAFDMLMTIFPAFFITVTNCAINVSAFIYACIAAPEHLPGIIGNMVYTVLSAYLLLFVVGLITGIDEWDKINCLTGKKIASFFTFPLFIMTYIPISIQAIFANVTWQPIKHDKSMSIDQMKKK